MSFAWKKTKLEENGEILLGFNGSAKKPGALSSKFSWTPLFLTQGKTKNNRNSGSSKWQKAKLNGNGRNNLVRIR